MPALSHTSSFSSHRKDIRSRDSTCGTFLDRHRDTGSAPILLHPLHSLLYFTLHFPCSSSPHTHTPTVFDATKYPTGSRTRLIHHACPSRDSIALRYRSREREKKKPEKRRSLRATCFHNVRLTEEGSRPNL